MLTVAPSSLPTKFQELSLIIGQPGHQPICCLPLSLPLCLCLSVSVSVSLSLLHTYTHMHTQRSWFFLEVGDSILFKYHSLCHMAWHMVSTLPLSPWLNRTSFLAWTSRMVSQLPTCVLCFSFHTAVCLR